jgi:GTP cyclohydrolase II
MSACVLLLHRKRRRKVNMKDNLANSMEHSEESFGPFAQTVLPTQFGDLTCRVYHGPDGVEHIAMVAGDVTGEAPVLCRVHSACMTSEILGSIRCDCKAQLDLALQTIANEGRGIVIYLQQEGRGIGLGNKIRAYALQEQGLDTVDANRALGLPDDSREYDLAAKILEDLEVQSILLMTNNPEKVVGLEKHGVTIRSRVPHLAAVQGLAADYVHSKQERMGHFREDRPDLKVCNSD